MEKLITFVLVLFYCLPILAEQNINSIKEPQQNYVNINIDNIAIDSDRIVQASELLAQEISQLSIALEVLATQDVNFTPEDRQALLNAAASVTEASLALTELANQLPEFANQLVETLPDTIKDSQQSIAQIARSIEAANETVNSLSNVYPQVLAQGENLVDQILDSMLQKITFYTLLIIIVFFLGLGGFVYYGYRKMFQPLLEVVVEFKTLPEQMAELSTQNRQTSENLLLLQQSLNQGEKSKILSIDNPE